MIAVYYGAWHRPNGFNQGSLLVHDSIRSPLKHIGWNNMFGVKDDFEDTFEENPLLSGLTFVIFFHEGCMNQGQKHVTTCHNTLRMIQ